MKNIKLTGMKEIRKIRNITLEEVATYLNLLSTTEVEYVVTSDYLDKIERRKQPNIDDNLLEALSKFFDVNIEDLINYQAYKDDIEPGRKIITLALKDKTNKVTKFDLNLPIELDVRVVNLIIQYINYSTEQMGIHLDVDTAVYHFKEVIKNLEKEEDFKKIIEQETLIIKYIDNYFNELGYSYLDKYSIAAERIYTNFKMKGFSEETCFHFVDIILGLMIDNDLL